MPPRKRRSPAKKRASPQTSTRRAAAPPAKIQRWIDLVAALLRRHYGATFEELSREIPAYSDGRSRDTILRMFERDKDELRELGVAIETVPDDGGEPGAYRLRARDFYLPYLSAIAERGRSTTRGRAAPTSVERAGYRALPRIAFEPEELAAVADALERVRQLEDPVLVRDAHFALRKLAFDLPIGALAANRDVAIVPARARADDHVFELLDVALRQRKRVTFDYRSMERDETSRRTVEAYGLFFLGSHWYLAARDPERDAIRNFRLNRIDRVEVNELREQSPDYSIPPAFDLRVHAESRQAWELGDGDAVDAIVSFRITDGALAAAARLGDPVQGDETQRRFLVRRTAPFVRWLLSLAGDAVPIAPPSVVRSFRECAMRTVERYGIEGRRRNERAT